MAGVLPLPDKALAARTNRAREDLRRHCHGNRLWQAIRLVERGVVVSYPLMPSFTATSVPYELAGGNLRLELSIIAVHDDPRPLRPRKVHPESSMTTAVPKLVAGLTRGLSAGDVKRHWQSLQASDEPQAVVR